MEKFIALSALFKEINDINFYFNKIEKEEIEIRIKKVINITVKN
jgi:hypothetical protein